MNPPAAFKPSDIFFNPPPERNRGAATPNNNKGGDFIIARDIEIRGWLIDPKLNEFGAFVLINGRCERRIEDFHYDIVPDLEWMLDPAQNPTLTRLVGTGLPGHGSVRDYVICPRDDPFIPDCLLCNHGVTTQRLPVEDLVPNSFNPNFVFLPGDAPCFDRNGLTTTCLPLGITPNSFILPGNPVNHAPSIIVELNAYWSDIRSDLSQSVLNAAFAAPSDPRIFWPFNPANPDGTGDLQRGDYVRIRGTFWQDGSHSEGRSDLACWEGGPLRGHGGWTEIHPVDLIERNPSRKLSQEELDDLLNGTETAPQKRAIPKTRFSVLAVCAPVELFDAVRAEDLKIVPTISRPSPACRLRVKEWIDGRLTDLRNVDQHSVTLVDSLADPHVDVHISLHSSGSLSGHGREGRFKAIYEVWWDCPPTISCPANVTVTAESGRSAASVIYSVTATDERPGVQVSCLPPNGSIFPVGVTLVRCTATDASGNQSTCSFPVEVLASPIQGNGTGLLGVYYDNMDFTSPRVARTEAVNFDWVLSAPAPGVDADTFSVRRTGKIVPRYSDLYRIFTVSDDGVRLWIEGGQIVNEWNDHGPTEHYGDIQLEAGQPYDVVLEMYENGGGATAKLLWQSGRQPKEPIPASQLLPARLECPTPNRPTFSANFVNGIPVGTAMFGQAVAEAGWLKLTTPDTAFGIFHIDNFSGTQPVHGFEAKFNAALFGSTCCGGGAMPADGFSFNLVPAASVRANPGYNQPGEEGLDEGLAVNFDTWDNGAGEGPAVEAKWRGQVIARQPFQVSQSPVGITTARGAALEVIINLTSDGFLTVSYGLIRVLDRVQTPYTPLVIGTPKWVIGARNGGANDNHWIRDLQIVVNRATIPGLFNTGVDNLGRSLTDNDRDLHYVMPGVPFVATALGGFPIGPWLPDSTASAWIAPSNNTYASPGAEIRYETTFDLKGLNPAGAAIHGWVAVDNQLVDILLNGQRTGQETPSAALGGADPFTSWQAFAIRSGILPGPNALTFVTQNGTGGDNPTGLRVEMCGWATPPPLLHLNIASVPLRTTVWWGSLPHNQYFLEHTDSLSGPWVREPGFRPGAYQAQFTEDYRHVPRDPLRFFRVIEAR